MLKIRGHEVITEEDTFTAEKIVVATHYPIKNVPGFYFLRQHQERSYVLALSGCKKISGMYLGIDGEELSFRQAGEYLLLGGYSHRTGRAKRCHARAKLEEYARKYFPEATIEGFWRPRIVCPMTESLLSPCFHPQRFLIRAGGWKFLIDVKESIKGLLTGLFCKKAPRCAHLGCGLHWNAEEESWDCPCHGSRYDEQGRLLDNPAVRNLDNKL